MGRGITLKKKFVRNLSREMINLLTVYNAHKLVAQVEKNAHIVCVRASLSRQQT